MIRLKQAAAFFLCSLALFTAPALGAAAEGDEPPPDLTEHYEGDVVYTGYGLYLWAEAHGTSGRTAVLGADIVIEDVYLPESASHNYIDFPLDAGDHTITVKSSLLLDDGSATHGYTGARITGSGAQGPVLCVSQGAELFLPGTSFDSRPSVTATGAGGVALRLCEGSQIDNTIGACFRVAATGENAVAVDADIPLYLPVLNLDVSAPGAGSVGIRCTGAVTLGTSRVEGGAASVQAPGLTTTACKLIPDAPGNHVQCTLSIVPDQFAPLMPGEAVPASLGGNTLIYGYLTPQGGSPSRVSLFVYIDPSFLDTIDTTVVGTHHIPLQLTGQYTLLNLVPADEPLTYGLVVKEPDPMPTYDSLVDPRGNGNLYAIWDWQSKPPDADITRDIVVWRSDDAGESWYTTEVLDDGAQFLVPLTAAEIQAHPVWLVVERRGYGESGIHTFAYEGNRIAYGYGGNRDGGDADDDDPPDLEQPAPQGGGDAGGSGPANQPAGQGAVPPAENTGAPRPTGRESASQPTVAQLPAAAAQPPMERVTATETAVSGLRLYAMADRQGDTVLFQKGAAAVLLPADGLRALGLADNDIFTVGLQPTASGVTLTLLVNGVPLDGLAGAQVRLRAPAPAEGEAVTVTGPGGSLPAHYDAERGEVVFTAGMAGEYAVSYGGVPIGGGTPQAQPPGAPLTLHRLLVPLASGMAALAAAGTVWLLLRRRRRGNTR